MTATSDFLELRLAVFTHQFPGHVSTFFSRDVRGLLEAGLDVDVFAIYPRKVELWRYVPDLLNERYLSKDKVHHTSPLRVFRHPKPWPLVRLSRFLSEASAIVGSAARFGPVPVAKSLYVLSQAWIWAQQYTEKYDHVLAYWANYTGTCAYLFHRLIDRQIPFSIYPHAGHDLYRNQVYLKQKLQYSDNIIVDCQFNKRFIEQLYPDIFESLENKIYLYHPGLDFAEFQYHPNDRAPRRIVAVGRLVKPKGFDDLLRTMQELKIRQIDAEIDLVGHGKEADRLRSLARDLRIDDRVTFHGWLTPERVRSVIANASLLIHPSSGFDDAVPNVIKEAMALGTPVIGASVSGIPELLDGGRCGILFPPRDVKALADAATALLTNESLRQEYARTGRLFAEQHFDLWQNGQKLAGLLRSTKRMKDSYNH